MKKIELFEPAMCCETGVCGPSVDPTLLMVSSVFEALNHQPAIEAARHNLNTDPDTFTKRPEVLKAMGDDAAGQLPITLVDGTIVKTGSYPSLEEFSKYTGLVFVPVDDSDKQGGCCGGGDCCC